MSVFDIPAMRLPARRKIFGVISQFPGLHFREVQRRTGIGTGALQYHLEVLERAGAIKVEKKWLGLRLYPRNISDSESGILSILHNSNYRNTLLFLLSNSRASQGQIASHVGVSPSTMSWYLKRLIQMNVVKGERTGKEVRYSIVDTQSIAKTLSAFRSSFLDKSVDNFLKTWDGLF